MANEKLIVASWPARKNREFNPFQALMSNALTLTGKVEVIEFSPIRAFWTYADIWHWHWPDGGFSGGWISSHLRYIFLRTLLVVARIRSIPIVWTLHNLSSHEGRWPVIEENIRQRLLQQVAGLHYLSESSRLLAESKYPLLANKKYIVTPHADYSDVANRFNRKLARSNLELEGTDFIFGFVGAISPYKGVDELYNAYDRLSRLNAHVSLIIAGRPSPKLSIWCNELAAKRDPRIHSYFRLLGQDEIDTIFSSIDIAVFPYRSITNSGSIIMALTLGVPVLVPKFPLTEELKADLPPYAVNLYDPPLTADVLSKVMADEKIRSTSINLPGRYHWSSVARQLIEFYSSVIYSF